MQTNFVQNSQLISNYKLIKSEYTNKSVTLIITKSINHTCPTCSSSFVTPTYVKQREIKGMSTGILNTIISVNMHRIKCHDCKSFNMEKIEFITSPYRRTTSALERFILSIRKHMSISAITKFYNLHWTTIKDIEKRYLKKKYENILLSEVKNIGIDEVYMGKSIGYNGFLTIVRDLDSGAVLFVGKGKSGATLDEFKVKLDKAGTVIEYVGVDLAASFTAWINKNIPSATIVYDHFHIIKLMNDKLNSLRRQTMNSLEEEEKKSLKSRLWHYIMNNENLNKKAEIELKRCNEIFKDLGTAYWLKESLRNIYSICNTYGEAKVGFKRWCELAMESNISQLKTMSKTISKKLEGILSFWKNGITSASMEGFNNKIGWLTRQAYGYRDEEYLILKIYDLPTLKLEQRLT